MLVKNTGHMLVKNTYYKHNYGNDIRNSVITILSLTRKSFKTGP